MSYYMIHSRTSGTQRWFPGRMSATKEAERIAEAENAAVEVYEHIALILPPEPQPVTCNVGKLIERMEECDVMSATECAVYGMLKRLNKHAVDRLDMPPGFKL